MPITAMLGVDARFETNEVLTRLIGDLLQPVSVMGRCPCHQIPVID